MVVSLDFDGTLVENKFPNIKYALDLPMIYTIDGKKTFVVPGAYSVDKEFWIYVKFLDTFFRTIFI